MFKRYIEGKDWGLKVMLSHLDYAVHFSSKRQWVKCLSVITLELCAMGVVFMVLVNLLSVLSHNDMGFLAAIVLGAWMALMVSMALWIATYIESFVLYDKLNRLAEAFIDKCKGESENRQRLDGNYWKFQAHGLEFQLQYVEEEDQSNRLTNKKKRRFALILNYVPKADYPSPFNGKGWFSDDFLHDWNLFAQGKSAFRHIKIAPHILFAVFYGLDTTQEEIDEVIEMMVYLLDKFHLMPLTYNQMNCFLRSIKQNKE